MLLQLASAIPEMLALILLLLLLAFSLTDSTYANQRTGLFSACLGTACFSTLSSLARILYQLTATPLPNGVYFLALLSNILAALTTALICTYILAETYAGTKSQWGFRVALVGVWGFFTLFVALSGFNHLHQLFFFVDQAGLLHITRLQDIKTVFFLALLFIITLNYLTHRREANSGLHHVMLLLPCLGLGIALFQAVTPPMEVDDITLGFVLLILLVCCQRQRVHHDHLTSVGTREALAEVIQRMIAAKQPFTLQQVSLLHFRRINRRYSLGTGDKFLRTIAHTIRSVCPEDLCFRFNGTDFVIFHAHLPNEESERQLAALRDRFTESWEIDNARMLIGVSFAQVSYPLGGETPEELINNLEYCQIQARDLPDSAVVIFDDTVRQKIKSRDQLNELITSGLTSNRFFLCYQPIYDATGTRPCAAEALLRMRDDTGAIVSPGVFIPVAEESGSIIPVTWMVLGKVCSFLNNHRKENLPPISINFSAQQFAEQDMCPIIRRYLDHYRIAPGQIKIEITERVFAETTDLLLRNIRGLQEMGIGLYLDDFGTGYSNLASLLNYPIEVVKVDKSFLVDPGNSRAQELLQALITGLKQLDVEVLIEGVETLEQSHRMQNYGVDRMQGFYYARPMEEQDFLIHMANNVA